MISQLNISVDPKYQLYTIRGLHNTPHAVEDNSKRDECSCILQRHHAKVIEMGEYSNGDGVEFLEGIAANYTSTSDALREVVGSAFPPTSMERLGHYIYTNWRQSNAARRRGGTETVGSKLMNLYTHTEAHTCNEFTPSQKRNDFRLHLLYSSYQLLHA